MSLINTQYWREEALKFIKEGTYCRFPKGSYQYREYWDEQTRRCIDGYSVGGIHIPGTYYYYLNFYPILGKDERTNKKTRIFPRVTDVDFEFFTELEIAKKEGKGFILVKPRRTGFSFKNSALLTHEYNFYRDAQCWIGAFQKDLAETTFNMGLQGLNFINENTAWKKNRDPDTREYVKARIKIKTDEGDIWKGYNSSIGRLTFMDNPFAAIGKCLGKGTKVLMFDGTYKNVEDVVIGDKLMGPDSTSRTVLSTTSGIDELFEISQKRGMTYIVNSEHKLYLEQRCNSNSVDSDGIKIINPKEFLELPQYKQNYTVGIKTGLIDFKYKEIPLDPYFLGLWLGDGSSAKTQITNIDTEIVDYLENFAKSNNLICTKYKESYTLSQTGRTKNGNFIRNSLKSLNLFNNKHIPSIYKNNSKEIRLKLIAGLIDSDGYKINDRYCEIIQKNKILAEDILFILRSLGFYAKLTSKKSYIGNKDCGEVYRIHFTGPLHLIPTLIKRKNFKESLFKTDYLKTPIKVTSIGRGEYYGFTLDKDHLFILEDFTITHNSANLFIFEEAGRWPGLIQSYNITEPCWRDGADMIGTPVIFGCVCAGTKVWTNDGREVNIEDLHQEEGIIGYGGVGVLRQPIIWKKPIGAKPCYRITLSNNKVLECSHDHPLLWSQRGNKKYEITGNRKKVTFKKAEEIKVGDQLMWARQVPIFGKERMWQPRLVGLLIGDGYYGTGAVELCTGDKEVYDWLVKSENIISIKKEFETKDLKWFTSVNINSCTSYLKDLGIFGQAKERKHLPEDIHKYDLYSIKELLGGYFDADGNVYYNKKKNAIRIVLTSKYKHLLEEVSQLLYKLGISCSIRKETRKGGYSSESTEIHRLYISKEGDIKQFKKHITFITKHKQETLDNYIFKNTSRHVHNNCYFELNSDNNKGTYFLEHNQLDNLESLYVKNVEFIGNQIVYNLNAGISHTYITNGFISGNTGGDMEGGTEEFAEMFYNPEKYNLKAFDNIWDEDVAESKCGWFFPAYKMRFGTYKDAFKEHSEWKNAPMVDENGNSQLDIAKQDILDFRRIKEQGVDQKAKQDAITQYPFNPKEAFLSNLVSRFPIGRLKAVRAKLNDEELNKHQIGKVIIKDGKAVFETSQSEVPYREYPVKVPREGCIEMYEIPHPPDEGGFNIRRYIAGIDPYNYDVSKSESIGCILIYDRITQRIVAEYSGKPEKTDKFYEICRRLLLFYDATALYEANITGLYHYFEKHKALHLLEDTPSNLRDRNVWKPGTNTSKGIIATKQVNEKGLEFIENWLKSPISVESEILNMDTIRSVGLLEELIKWEPDPRKNFDRISALSMVMWFDQTLTEYAEQEKVAQGVKTKFGKHFNKFKKNPLDMDYDKYFKIES